ncbi:hypothetical protein KC722_00125 [Candidatus Kaiserbacteria bacterium]|nr:hypothetical protein [Candidatus Kaiserbacteria bacterium]MCB9811336.1 hypothetical protein [Candidatus Nomurabacteria bacterium]
MHQGNWTCSGCGKAITELPFEPRSTDGLLCRECHQKAREERDKQSAPTTDRKMFTGDWKCATCGGPITELPFEPRSTDNLKCRDCFMKSR